MGKSWWFRRLIKLSFLHWATFQAVGIWTVLGGRIWPKWPGRQIKENPGWAGNRNRGFADFNLGRAESRCQGFTSFKIFY